MKRWKKYAGLLLALVLCLSLTACGGGNADVGGDESKETTSNAIPDSIEDLVLDDSVEYDYSYFLGEWLDEEGNVITVEEYDDGRVHFLLSDANEDLIAGGPLQYVEEYGCVYAYNDYDGIAYLCWLYADDTMDIYSFGTFAKASGDMPEETFGDGTDDAPWTIYDATTLGNPVEYDYSAFLGTWVGTDGTTLTVKEENGEGAPFVLLDRYGNTYTQGIFRYVEEYGCVYAIDNVGGDGSRCLFDGNDTLEIPGYSTFSRVNGDESDYIVIYGTWYPDGDESASRCIEFDSDGALWSMYERNTNGLWDGVDGGTLYVTGVNQYEAVSDWYEDERFDCYFEGDTMYWGSEDSGYEEYY